MWCCFLAVSLPMAIRGLKVVSRGPTGAPRGAPDGPTTALRAPRSVPRASQDESTMQIFEAPEGSANWMAPRSPPELPRAPQQGLKRRPGCPTMSPSCPHEAP
eukprot:9487262-Pyramimonas_sp.AAC.1